MLLTNGVLRVIINRLQMMMSIAKAEDKIKRSYFVSEFRSSNRVAIYTFLSNDSESDDKINNGSLVSFRDWPGRSQVVVKG